MADQGPLLPITREFLRNWCEPLPVPEPTPEFLAARAELDDLVEKLSAEAGGSELRKKLVKESPKKIEENMFRCREQCEYITEILALPKAASLKGSSQEFQDYIKKCFDGFDTFQTENSERVKKLVADFMPQDFRANMVAYQHERSEKAKQAEIAKLISAGGSIEDKYNLLWAHQLARREKLVALGNASGVWKAILKMIAGVPTVLLDFIKTINDELGPVEELRVKCAPPLYELRGMLNQLHLALALAVHVKPDAEADVVAVSTKAAKVLWVSTEAYLVFLKDVFTRAPWFVRASELASSARSGGSEDFIKVSVDAGGQHDVKIQVEAGTVLGWEFSTEDKDIAFTVLGPNDQALVPSARHESHVDTVKGSVPVKVSGNHTLRWDNSFSYFTGKSLRYRTIIVESADE